MSLRIALFGQAPLAVDVLDGLLDAGHEIAAVYAPPDTGRPDPLAERAEARGLALFRRPRTASVRCDQAAVLEAQRRRRSQVFALEVASTINPIHRRAPTVNRLLRAWKFVFFFRDLCHSSYFALIRCPIPSVRRVHPSN